MTGLMDIGDLTFPVRVGKVTLTVRGLTSADLVSLCIRFPGLRKLVESGAGAVASKISEGEQSLLTTLPEAVWAAMAICTGDGGNYKAEQRAATLPLSSQVSILHAILRATLTEGLGPFVAAIDDLTKSMTAVMTGEEEASPSDSQEQSPAALVVDLPPRKPGLSRRAN